MSLSPPFFLKKMVNKKVSNFQCSFFEEQLKNFRNSFTRFKMDLFFAIDFYRVIYFKKQMTKDERKENRFLWCSKTCLF